MVAEVIINSSVKNLNKTFDYEIPSGIDVHIGSRVSVPFGNKKELEEGIVIRIKEKSSYKIKEIAGLQDEQIADEYIELAKWMANRYFCNLSDTLNLMLPPGRKNKNVLNRVKDKTLSQISLAKTEDEIKFDIENKTIKGKKQIEVLEFLIKNNNASMQDIEMFVETTSATVNALFKKGYLKKEEVKIERNPFIHKVINKSEKLDLTDEQKKAYNNIGDNGEYLLYGITGSRENRNIFAIN